ncbi:MAG: YeiH family protein [Planctomycetaceae bacterium]
MPASVEDRAKTGSGDVGRGRGLHEDLAAVLIGAGLLILALAVTWAGRPDGDRVSREAHPKGWPTPLAATVGLPGTWTDSPLAAFRDGSGRFAVAPVALGMGWVVAVGTLGAVLGGGSVRRFLPGGALLAALTCLAYLLAAQKVVKFYNLEYPLWALAVGLLVGNVGGVPRWLTPALLGEFFIKTGLVVFGAEVLVSRLLALGLPGLMTAWIVTPVVLVSTYLFGVHALRIPSRPLCMTLAADMSVCGVSAAIATGAACRAKKEELSLAIGLSLFFTVIMMVAMPPAIRALGLDPLVGGAWIGGTIDATGAVVAAGESLGRDVGEVAATVKMIQNSMIGLIAFAVAAYWAGWIDRDVSGPRGTLLGEAWRRFPRFILGFLGASLVCSALHGLGPAEALWVEGATTGFTARVRGWLFCAGFVCMGLQTNVRELAPLLASGRPVVLYLLGQALNLVLTLAMASLTFGWLFRKAVAP